VTFPWADHLPVTQLLWGAAGRPCGAGSQRGACRVCGLPGQGLLFSEWARPTFTDWDKLSPGNIICHACQFAFKERSTLLAAHVGKVKPQRMRNYSHFVVGGEWVPLSKADKYRMAAILLNEVPDVAVIAESGQKHILFRAVPGVVQFEEQQLRDVSPLKNVLQLVEGLYKAFSKQEITSGEYKQRRILKFGLAEWRSLESQAVSWRGTALFELAVFLAQKGEA